MMERQEDLPTLTPRDRLVVAAASAAAAFDMAAGAASGRVAAVERELVAAD